MTEYQKRVVEDFRDILSLSLIEPLIKDSIAENPWFTKANIIQAYEAIRAEMLDMEKASNWIETYPEACDLSKERCRIDSKKRVGIVMAGNIPMVGFFDLFCVILMGYRAIVKPSSKDSILISFVVKELTGRGYKAEIVKNVEEQGSIEMLIATGGSEAAKYYSEKFCEIPSLIRGNRHSVAVLSGDETADELDKLIGDMFTYWGLGCRNVTQLYLPMGYDVSHVPEYVSQFKRYDDNYRHNRAFYSLSGAEFFDKKGYVLLMNSGTVSLGVVGCEYYDDYRNIKLPEEAIQCVVTHLDIDFPRKVGFGQTQQPDLFDYPDSKDIIKFLLNSFN